MGDTTCREPAEVLACCRVIIWSPDMSGSYTSISTGVDLSVPGCGMSARPFCVCVLFVVQHAAHSPLPSSRSRKHRERGERRSRLRNTTNTPSSPALFDDNVTPTGRFIDEGAGGDAATGDQATEHGAGSDAPGSEGGRNCRQKRG